MACRRPHGRPFAGGGNNEPVIIVGKEPFRENALVDCRIHVVDGNTRHDGSLRRLLNAPARQRRASPRIDDIVESAYDSKQIRPWQ